MINLNKYLKRNAMKKYIYKFSYFLMAILLLTVLSCERDTNGPLPDEGMRDAAVAYILFDDLTTDYLVDLVDPNAFNLDYTVGTLWEPTFQKIQVVVVYNGDYSKQYVVADNITSVPATGSILMADIVAAVDEISVVGDIVEGDEFHFFCNTTLNDGSVMKMYDNIGDKVGQLMINAGLMTALASVEGVGGPALKVAVPCAFIKSDYIGAAVDCYEEDFAVYPIVITERADLGDANTLVLQMEGLFSGVSNPAATDAYTIYNVEINLKNYFLNADDQLVLDGNTFGYGLGRLWFDDFRNSELNTCKQYIKFHVTADLNDTGYWFGPNGPVFYIGPGAQAAATADGVKSSEEGIGTVLKEPPYPR
jgi:hypothetical protein